LYVAQPVTDQGTCKKKKKKKKTINHVIMKSGSMQTVGSF